MQEDSVTTPPGQSKPVLIQFGFFDTGQRKPPQSSSLESEVRYINRGDGRHPRQKNSLRG